MSISLRQVNRDCTGLKTLVANRSAFTSKETLWDAPLLFLNQHGSSGSVYPAAGLVSVIAHRRNRGSSVRSIYVGPEAPNNAKLFDEIRLGTACEMVPNLFHILFHRVTE